MSNTITAAAAVLSAVTIIAGIAVLCAIMINENRYGLWATTNRHLLENHDELQALLLQAARENHPGAAEVLEEIPQQKTTARCSTPPHDLQARGAIGILQTNCRLSLYGAFFRVEADYLVFKEYREFSAWEHIRGRMRYPIRDAYLDINSLEIASPHRALRINPDDGRAETANERVTKPGPDVLRLADLETSAR